MNATTSLALLAVFGLGAAVGVQTPQGKENAPGAPPKLTDMLKGYIGLDCWYQTGSSGFYWLRFTPSPSMPTLIKTKLELVGQDFVKLSNEVVVPLSHLSEVSLRKP
jgi:hypothetical protein